MQSHSALSLIERKKLQWAKEKEEMAELKVPWTAGDENYTTLDRNVRQFRRSSLPPLYKNQFNSYDKEKEIGGETSGYGSDNPTQTPEHVQGWHQTGYESSSSIRDDRPKWSTAKTSELAKFWPSKDELSESNEPPNWVKRGLKNGEIIVNNTSPAESPEQLFDDDRPQTGSSHSNNHNYLRGQNIHMDPTELAERERKRQLALAHQYAILQQLNEREKRRQEEKERRIKEEYEEELRIEREQEIERIRKEQEMKSLKEKLEKEKTRKKAVEEAMQIAQKEAQLAKSTKNKHNYYLNNLQKQSDVTEDNKITVEIEETRSQGIESVSNDLNNNLNTQKTDSETSSELNLPNSTSCPNLIVPQTLALPAQLETLNLQRVQYALLIPTTTTKTLCHVATQTDESSFRRLKSESAREESKVQRPKDRRSRSESLEERPKWGANRPPTRYVKQSDKDPLYQRRKLRQTLEQEKGSSDESANASPRMYRKKGRSSRRHSRIDWRKQEKFCRAEVVPLGYDKDRLYCKRGDYCCICRCGRHKCSE